MFFFFSPKNAKKMYVSQGNMYCTSFMISKIIFMVQNTAALCLLDRDSLVLGWKEGPA